MRREELDIKGQSAYPPNSPKSADAEHGLYDSNKRLLWVGILELRPSQGSIGFAAAKAKRSGWENEADQEGLSLKRFVETIMKQRFTRNPLPAFIDPDGHIRIIDGHHKIWALRSFVKESGIFFDLPLSIEQDFRGASIQTYQDVMAKQYPIAEISPKERVLAMADSFEHLKDNPLRSLVGQTLRRIGVRSHQLQHYAQFTLCKALHSSLLFQERLKALRLLSSAGELTSMVGENTHAIDTLSLLLSHHEALRTLLLSLAKDDASKAAIRHKLLSISSLRPTEKSDLLHLKPRRPTLPQHRETTGASHSALTSSRRPAG